MPGLFYNNYLAPFTRNGVGPLRNAANTVGNWAQQFFSNQKTGSVANLMGTRLGLADNPLAFLQEPGAVYANSPYTLEQQFNRYTGGQLSTLNNPSALRALTLENNPSMLDPARVSGAILDQFGLANSGFDVNNVLTNGQLDLSKISPSVLAGMRPDDIARLRSANVLGRGAIGRFLTEPMLARGTPKPGAASGRPVGTTMGPAQSTVTRPYLQSHSRK